MTLGAEQNQILRSITTLREDMGQIGDQVTDVNNRLESLGMKIVQRRQKRMGSKAM
jgi:hypothetical protein